MKLKPHLVVTKPESPHPLGLYLTRWHLLKTRWFGVYLHKIDFHDLDRHPHDHPWNFFAFILRGGYDEEVIEPINLIQSRVKRNLWRIYSLHKMPKGKYHRILRLTRTPTWSLIFVGRSSKKWGYWVDNVGWVDHYEYWRDYLPVAQEENEVWIPEVTVMKDVTHMVTSKVKELVSR